MNEKIWAYFIHLGINDWMEKDESPGSYEGAATVKSYFAGGGEECSFRCASDKLRCNKKYFRALIDKAHKSGVNTIVIDIAEGLKYETHPELAADGAWTPDELASEIAYIKSLGMDVLPSMDFSAAHDEWLGAYARMVSTPTYYKVIADLIKEIAALFGSPKLFYIGMGDEDSATQAHYGISIVRHGDLWWHDFYYIVKQVEACGGAAWASADRLAVDEALYLERMSKEVIQGHYLRFLDHDLEKLKEKAEADAKYKVRYERLNMLVTLGANGFKQIPIGGNYTFDDQLRCLVTATKKYIPDESVLGYAMTTYVPTLPALDVLFTEALVDVERAIQTYDGAELPTKRRMLY